LGLLRSALLGRILKTIEIDFAAPEIT